MNIQALISVLEDANLSVTLAEGGTELVVACPLCFSESAKLYIAAATGQWLCFKCDARGHLRRLLIDVCELPFQEAVVLERSIRGGTEQRATLAVPRPAPPSTVELPSGFQLDPGDGLAADYFKSRRLFQSWVPTLGAGYCLVGTYACRVIVPVVTQGQLCTFVARTWRPDEPKKVLMPEGSQASRALFGYDWLVEDSRWKNLILVEGIFDAIRMWEWGYSATVATLGAHVTDLQRSLVKRLKPETVVLLMDSDDTGREAAIKGARELAYDLLKVKIAHLPDGTDPDSASSEDIRQALDTARPVELDFGIESQKEVHHGED